MKITEIQIVPIKAKNGLIAFASVVLEDSIYLSSIGVHARVDGSGYRLTYPTKKLGDTDLNIYHPITRSLSKAIEQAVVAKVNLVLGEERCNKNVRYNNYTNP